MSRRSKDSESRNGQVRRAGKQRGRGYGKQWLLVASLVAAAVTVLLLVTRSGHAHPDPRPGITAEGVVHPLHYQRYPRIAATYGKAREIPQVLDGLHCYCECEEHSGHYSLLDCFKSDHGANCDVCLTSAELAWQLAGGGKSLEEIRSALDDLYRR
ncbi:MAG: hypothetical protein HY703_02725 [Gemmatimonadetes bacterium]|nr:hypothetical protein [Gemmatimonadota bacterium]